MLEYNDFFVATAGAAAALAGLIFVGVSINIKEIVGHPLLPGRASLALIMLMSILVSSIVVLTHFGIVAAGILFLITGVCQWVILTIKDVGFYKQTPQQYRRTFLMTMVMDQLASIPYVIGSICFIESKEAGIYFIAAAYSLSFIKSVWNAWVLLIEILR